MSTIYYQVFQGFQKEQTNYLDWTAMYGVTNLFSVKLILPVLLKWLNYKSEKVVFAKIVCVCFVSLTTVLTGDCGIVREWDEWKWVGTETSATVAAAGR